MISVVHWIGRGRLAERPEQVELGPAEMEDLVAKQSAMQLDKDDVDANDDSFSSSYSSSADDVDAGMDRLSAHIVTHDDDADADTADDPDDAANGEDSELPQSDSTPRPSAPVPSASFLSSAPTSDPTGDRLLSELAMSDYDDEPDGAELFLGGHKLTVHQSNQEDPYITVPDDADADASDDDDVLLRPSDAVLAVGRTEHEHSAVEVYVYDAERANLFIHHDFQIPSFPLCLHFLSAPIAPSAAGGAYLAVGTFLPGIELWNLNVLDALEPTATLGGYVDESVVGKKKGSRRLRDGSHSDAVLCLGWHEAHAERLASGSADDLVKLWDVTTQQCTRTLTHHQPRAVKSPPPPPPPAAKSGKKGKKKAVADDEGWYEEAQEANASHKVQSLQWNPTEPSLLLTGSYDRTAQLVDVRAASASSRVHRVDSDVETVRWHPTAPLFLVATESGLVYLFDARKPDAALFRLSAHEGATTSAAFNPLIPRLFLTAGADRTVKMWEVGAEGGQPSLLATKEVKVGAVWSAGWDVDDAALMACGGDKGKVAVWDVRENADIVKRFGKELGETAAEAEGAGTKKTEHPHTNGQAHAHVAALKATQLAGKKKGKKKQQQREVADSDGGDNNDEKE